VRTLVTLLILVAASAGTFLQASRAGAHGTPIQVNVVNNSLSVSGGLADSAGFAPMIFVESTEEGDPFGQVTLPGFGFSTIWQIPGYEISGMDEHSGLFLDVMSRPVAVSNPVDHRSLWYWNPTTQRVSTTPAANPLQIRKSSSVNVTLSPTDVTDPPALLIAEPMASDEGFHNHLVAYALSETSPSPAGAYGFFARLTSKLYGPSDPFLVVLNDGVFEYEKMMPAALAINAAAFLPGDYNHDERVDAADYGVWRKTFGSTTKLAADGSGNQQIDQADFDVWRRNFGTSVAGSGATISNVPEPNGWLLAAVGVVGPLLVLSMRASNAPHCFARARRRYLGR
jgi:hypothetical protein